MYLLLFLEPDVAGINCFFRSSFACGYTWGNQWTYIHDCKSFIHCIYRLFKYYAVFNGRVFILL